MTTDTERMLAFFDAFPEGGRLYQHHYRDGSIDVEVLWTLDRGVSVEDVIDKIQDALDQPYPRGTWISTGLRFAIRDSDDEVIYRKAGGMNEVSTFWQRANRANAAESLLIVTERIKPGTDRRIRRKPASVFVRLRYSEKKPTRSGAHPKKGKRKTKKAKKRKAKK